MLNVFLVLAACLLMEETKLPTVGRLAVICTARRAFGTNCTARQKEYRNCSVILAA